MAVTTTTTKVQFAGDDTTEIFPVTSFKIYAASEITVQIKNTSAATVAGIAAGDTVLLVLTTDYTVALSGSATGVAYTFTVTIVNATYDNLPVGLTLIIRRILPRTQTTSLADNTPTPANTSQQMIDRAIMLIQQQQEILDRGVIQDIDATSALVLPEPDEGKTLKWESGALVNSDGDPDDAQTASAASAAAAAVSAAAALASETAAGDSETAAAASAVAADASADAAAASAIAAAAAVSGFATSSVQFIIDGGGSAITIGVKGDIRFPFACTITKVSVLANESGSIVLDLWKDTYANFPPTVADTITASAKPTLASATKAEDSTLTGWTTAIAAGSTLRVNVDSITTCTRVALVIEYLRT